MNICLVSREYPPETGWGGIGTYTYNLAHALTDLNHVVHVIAFAPEIEKDYLDNKVFVHRIKQTEIRGAWRLDKYLPVSLVLYSRRVADKLEELRLKDNIEIIEFPNWYAEGFWWLFFRNKLPSMIKLHTPYFEILNINKKKFRIKDRLHCWLEKITVLKCGSLGTHSLAHRDNMSKAYDIPSKQIGVIPHGLKNSGKIDVNEMGREDGKINILYVSRLEHRKGIDVLFEIIPEVLDSCPNVSFSIIGRDHKDKYQTSLKSRLRREADHRVNFLGYVEMQDLDYYYKNCSIFIVPSLYESFGLVYLEAMRCGKPVIGCNAGGIPELIKNEVTGLLVEPNDAPSLFNATVRLVRDKQLRNRLGQNAYRNFLEYFTAEKMAALVAQSYMQLVETKKGTKNGYPAQ